MSANATRQVRQVRTLQSSIVVAESVCAIVKNNIHTVSVTESDVQVYSVHVITYSLIVLCFHLHKHQNFSVISPSVLSMGRKTKIKIYEGVGVTK